MILVSDERIHNTFHGIKASFDYALRPEPGRFSMNIEAKLLDRNQPEGTNILFHEDMLYALNLAFREFVDVVKSYGFGDYRNLSLNVSAAGVPWILNRDQLETFRRRQVDMAGLLSFVKM